MLKGPFVLAYGLCPMLVFRVRARTYMILLFGTEVMAILRLFYFFLLYVPLIEKLKEHFGKYGTVAEVNLKFDPVTKRSR